MDETTYRCGVRAITRQQIGGDEIGGQAMAKGFAVKREKGKDESEIETTTTNFPYTIFSANRMLPGGT